MKELISGPNRRADRPDPQWVKPDPCPMCGGEVVSNCYYVGGKGYIILHECWESLPENPTCDFRKVI